MLKTIISNLTLYKNSYITYVRLRKNVYLDLDNPKIISMNQLTTKKNMQQAMFYLHVIKISNNLTYNLQKCCKLNSLPELKDPSFHHL